MTKREQPSSEPPAANPYATQMVAASPLAATILVHNEAGQLVQVVALSMAGLSVGRLPVSGLVLDAPMISRSHLRIAWDGQQAHVTDLGSTSGTLLGNDRLAAQQPILWKPDQWLQLGPYRLQLHPGSYTATASAPTAAFTDTAPRPAELSAPTRALSALDAKIPDVFAAPPPVAAHVPAVTHILDDQPKQATIRVVTGASVSITPGQRAVVSALMINQSAAAERFVIALEGVPAEWVQLPAPLAIGAGEQTMASVMIMVPIETSSTARVYPVTLRLHVYSSGGLVDHVVMDWTVLPFTDGQIALDPKRVVGRQRAMYSIGVTNSGNAPTRFALSADEEEANLVCILDTNQVLVEPGQTVQVPLKVEATNRLVGSERRYSFTVKATTPGLRPLSAAGVFAQQALFSIWALAIGIVVVLALIVLTAQFTGVFASLQPTSTPILPTLTATVVP